MKNLIIFTGVDGQPSMRKVYSQMTTGSNLYLRRTPANGNPFIRVYANNSIEDFTILNAGHPDLSGMKVIRWGNRIDATTDKSSVVYNKSSAIKNATNKKISRLIFTEKGVRTPAIFTGEKLPVSYPVIARPSHHAKGHDFVILNSEAEFLEHFAEHDYLDWYYSEYIDKDKEFRVYVGHGKVLGVADKPRPEDKTQMAWNQAINHDAWRLLKWDEYNHDVVLQACKAVEALGLDFGGVDVILKGDKAYVLEVNTAPTVSDSPMMSLKFSKYFDWLNMQDKRRDHWDFSSFSKAKSFAWKEFQLKETK